jgi:hypothetical protein
MAYVKKFAGYCRMAVISAFFAALVFLRPAFAQQPRLNPFLSAEEEAFLAKRGKPAIQLPFVKQKKKTEARDKENLFPVSSLRVSAIMYAPPKSKAVVEGHILQENDVFYGKTLISIKPESLVFEDRGVKYVVNLRKVNE